MKISKHYEENILVGNYQSVKIGLTIHSDKDLKTGEELVEHSGKLNDVAKQIIKKELAQIKEERQKEAENG